MVTVVIAGQASLQRQLLRRSRSRIIVKVYLLPSDFVAELLLAATHLDYQAYLQTGHPKITILVITVAAR